jgi:hypothetical protein
MQRFRAFVRSWCYHDELSFRRLFLAGRLQFSNPCRTADGGSSRFVTNSPFSKRTRFVCASSAPTGSCGPCSRDCGLVGAVVCTSCAPIRWSLGTAERSRGTDAEITAASWKTERGRRNSQLDSEAEPSKPVVGSTPHSRGTAQVQNDHEKQSGKRNQDTTHRSGVLIGVVSKILSTGGLDL